MEESADRSINANNDCIANNSKVHKICDSVPFEMKVDDKSVVKTSQLLSLDGWERYQQELIQLCFEFWEVDETQTREDNGLQFDYDITTPPSLFVEKKNDCGNSTDYDSEGSNDNVVTSKNEERHTVTADNRSPQNRFKDGLAVQQSPANATDGRADRKIDKNGPEAVNVGEPRERVQRKKKSKKFSFYKHAEKRVEPDSRMQSTNRYRPEDQWRCKKRSDSAEKTIENRGPDAGGDGAGEGPDGADRTGRNVGGPIGSSSEKEAFLSGIVGAATGPTVEYGRTTDYGTAASNRFGHFFRTAFRPEGRRRETSDVRLLDEYCTAEYVGQKLYTWQTLFDSLEDVRQKDRTRTAAADPRPEDATTVGRGFSGNGGEDGPPSRFVRITAEDGNTTVGKRRRKNKFLKLLLDKTKNAIDVRAASPKRSGGGDDYDNYYYGRRATRPPGGAIDDFRWRWRPTEPDRTGSPRRRRIRKCSSDSDVSRIAVAVSAVGEPRSTGTDRGRPSPDDDDHGGGDDRRRDARARRELREMRRECFETAAARLEYVGGAFGAHHRPAGLRALCRVDVLASFGRPAEAVDLFVRAALPLSDDPGLMVRRAEAAYDWEFFCHLSMWRYAYKD